MFDASPYAEAASRAVRTYLHRRDFSLDPNIRNMAHYQGELSGMELSQVINRDIDTEDVEFMKKEGYRILEFGKFNFKAILEGLKIFKNIFGHVDVPVDYIVTQQMIDDKIGYGDYYLDLDLGHGVESLRAGDIDGFEDVQRRKELDALGFLWGDLSQHLRFRFVPMFIGLRIYHMMHGICLPPEEWCCPDEEEWPYWMLNMPLGRWTSICRVQQQLLLEKYPQRHQMLRELGFKYWIPASTLHPKYFSPLRLDDKLE